MDAHSYAGLRTVPIEQIRGSEGRSKDFDRDFNPLQDHCMSRWLRVAAARDQGKVLPPVVLVQVGDVYFVRDGHHRISVARALGQLDIGAEVTVAHVNGPLPWHAPKQPSRLGLPDCLLRMGHAFSRRWLQGLAGTQILKALDGDIMDPHSPWDLAYGLRSLLSHCPGGFASL